MFADLLASIGVFWVVVLSLVALFFITRIPWWTARVCVPSLRAVEAVQEHAPSWRAQAVRWMVSIPERLTVYGFFAFLLWPVMIFLNLLLMAQVLEMFEG